MIRIGSKNNHTTAEFKSTWKGLQGKCTLQKMSLMVHRTKLRCPQNAAGYSGEEKRLREKLMDRVVKGQII